MPLCVVSQSFHISTHALREEGDCQYVARYIVKKQFLPTPSARRATPEVCQHGMIEVISTHALREEGDVFLDEVLETSSISTHALREEGDARSVLLHWSSRYFYPRPPRGGRLLRPPLNLRPINFYPRPPRGGRLAASQKHV
mgnify:CR=1 FL=1